jgi:hypothetical protein
MCSNPAPLSPADRRALAADLLARRLLELASRGILLDVVEAEPALTGVTIPAPEPQPAEATDGPR